ncbi:MAG: Thiol-disulfide oxidoreductase ResA [Bacteroidia bacterium]|nr:Thiol-disulfide oxidoreductase ResA [Bacteroidia bacterium]
MSRYFIFFLVLLFAACNSVDGLLDEGTMLPDYSGFTPTGDTLKLSTFTEEEKILFVNFWAAWCSDCLKHNPELVQLNKTFSGKKFGGHEFEMVSISLDQDTGLWKRRIVQQNMNWKNHITDSRGWDSKQLKAFSVHAIPANYLVDHTGKIIASDVEGGELEKILSNYYER